MSVFDRSITLERLGGDAALLVELAQLYTSTARQQLDTLRSALGAGKIEEVYREAHSLKGATSVFEAPAAVASLLALESAAKAGNHAEVVPLAAAADALVMVLIEHLENPAVLQPAS
jgi:HPt (histidine-containing phosphotransfer) domain-containing protein